MALGAERRAVVLMVVRQGMSIAIAGLVLGVAAALALTRVMTGLLYEVTPTDPATFAAVSRRPCRNRARSVLRARVQGCARRPARCAETRVAALKGPRYCHCYGPAVNADFGALHSKSCVASGPRFWLLAVVSFGLQRFHGSDSNAIDADDCATGAVVRLDDSCDSGRTARVVHPARIGAAVDPGDGDVGARSAVGAALRLSDDRAQCHDYCAQNLPDAPTWAPFQKGQTVT